MPKSKIYSRLRPTGRVLLGPGPSMVHPRVYEALAKKLDGHLDPEFLAIMDETQEMLRQVMGESSRPENVTALLFALESTLFATGVHAKTGAGLAAAAAVYGDRDELEGKS